MTLEEIQTKHGQDMFRLGLEYALVMIDIAEITETDLKQILKDKIKREFGDE